MEIAVIINQHARRGSQRVAEACKAALPDARVLLSRTLEEAAEFADRLVEEMPQLVISAGGDGSAVALLNTLRATEGTGSDGSILGPSSSLAMGVMPLGTGNGWARVTGAPRWRRGVEQLGRLAREDGPLPITQFNLINVDGVQAPFAGTGWDAEMLDDYHSQRERFKMFPKPVREGLPGYLMSVATRTIPRNLFGPKTVELELWNTGDDALGVDDDGNAYPLPGGESGALLYRGPANVCGAGTSQQWGFGMKGFPFAGLVPGRFHMRVFGGTAFDATLRMRQIWRGQHPMAKTHNWLLNRCKLRFDRDVPFQIGGDRVGHKREIEYSIASTPVNVLNWAGLQHAA